MSDYELGKTIRLTNTAKRIKRGRGYPAVRYIFARHYPCDSCGGDNTYQTQTRGRVQYRVCRDCSRDGERYIYKQIGQVTLI